jgi:glycosyltransferase involved in cell wall biosynthesis
MFNVATQLSKNNSVTIVTLLRNKKQLEEIEELKKLNFKVHYIKISLLESLLNIFKAIFTTSPFQVAFYKSERMKNKVYELSNSGNFDVVYYHLIRSAQYLSVSNYKTAVLNVIDFTDAISLYLNRFYEMEKNPIKKILLGIEKKRVEKYEHIAEKFHSVFICSEIDRDYLKQKGIGANIKIIRNGINLDYFKPDDINYKKNRIIFTGNMPYYANYDAAIYFAEKIFPLVLKEVPDAKFFIVGQNPPFRIRSLAKENIIVTGFVKDIREEYLKSVVNVAPMRFGAGTSNKINESLILGVPVIATPLAVEGFPPVIKEMIHVASDPKEFAERVVSFLKNPNLREKFMECDKSEIKNLLNTESIVKELENYLADELKKLI